MEPVATLADLGITKKTSMIAQQLADLPQAQFEQVRDGTVTLTKALRDTRRAKGVSINKPAMSLDSVENDIRLVLNLVIERDPDSHTRLAELLRRIADEVDEAGRHEHRDAVVIVRDELSISDSDQGGYRVFQDGICTGGFKSTRPLPYRRLTRAADGATPLTRRQFDARANDIDKGKLPTKQTARTHFAVLNEIKNLPRTSPLSRGGRNDHATR